MEKKIGIDDIPDDVLWVWSLEDANGYGNCIGIETYRKIQEVMKRYPEWFKKDEVRPSDFLDYVKVKGVPSFQWRDREFFDLMVKVKEEGKQLVYTRGRQTELKIMDIMEKQVIEYMKASDIVDRFNLKGSDKRIIMKFEKGLEKNMNGRSFTRRYEEKWKKAKRMGWYWNAVVEARKKFIRGIDPYLPEIRRRPWD